MFRENDLVVYGTKGVCRILEIGYLKMPGTDREKLYYTLKPLFWKDSVVYTPVDNPKVIMRDVISKDRAMMLIDDIPNIELIGIEDDKKRESIYHDSLVKCDCRELVKVIKTLQKRKTDREAAGKKVTSVDEKYLYMAEQSLYAELSVTLKVPREEMREFIAKRVEKTCNLAVKGVESSGKHEKKKRGTYYEE